jgi:hypothetical protein
MDGMNLGMSQKSIQKSSDKPRQFFRVDRASL